MTPARTRAGSPAEAAASPAQSLRVLLVEDDPFDFQSLRLSLESSPDCTFVVDWARSVGAAAALLAAGGFDICLIDHDLGGETGFDLIARTAGIAEKPPFILISGVESDEVAETALRLGVHEYLVKSSVSGGDLVRAVRHAVERSRMEARMARMANFDPLTGLYNRAVFPEHVRQALARHRRNGGTGALFFLDLDRFKTINDNLGHDAGDEVLCEVARRIGETLRESDIVARLGGDEFAAFVDAIHDAANAAKIARKLLRALARPCETAGGRIEVGCSIGIAVVCDGAEGEDRLMRAADLAMYDAKQAGGGRFAFYSETLSRRARRRMSLEAALADALRHDRMAVAFQPIFRAADLSPVAVEALARWPDGAAESAQGGVRPADFIPIAEEAGLIDALGEGVLARACETLREVANGSGALRMTVNLSMRQLQSRKALERLLAILRETRTEPQRIVFEITEGHFASDGDGVLDEVRRIKNAGAAIAVDDFGTGHSSLARLLAYPVDILKIDRAFVDTVDRGPPGAALFGAIVRVGEALGAEIVAEGVETDSQLAAVRGSDCTHLQGFRLARPLCAAGLRDFLAAGGTVPPMAAAPPAPARLQ